jgi:transmembrane sensor
MSESSDWTLLARYLSRECSAEEKIQVEDLIASDPETQRLLESMKTVWNVPDPQPGTSNVNRLWSEIAEETGMATGVKTPRERSYRTISERVVGWFQPRLSSTWRYAAVAVLLMISSLTYFQAQEAGIFPWGRQAAEWVTLAVGSGDRDEITLSDGTRIRLDAGSILRYPEAFDGEERTVFLSGEGYFEVTSDVEKPFVVHADHAVVEVLGTRFNVRAWQVEHRVTVSVVEGKVALGSERRVPEAVEIAKGQTSTLLKTGLPSEPRSIDIDRHLGWMHQEAFFDSVPLQEILNQLERWYDVRFVLEDTAIAAEQLTMHIQTDSLDDALELISALTDLDCERTGRSVRLKPRNLQ